jgi:tetratricopeptide (TPR) repeat protein
VILRVKEIFNQHFIFIIAAILTIAMYSKFLFFGHISWDDPEMVFKNKAVQNFDLKALFTSHYVGNYIPVTMLVHAITWFLFENNDGWHHTVNILFHLINGILIYKLGSRLFKNDFITNTGAIVFLLHPLQIESVGWISELKNVLSATFYLAGLIFYLKYLSNKKQKDYLLTLLLFMLACLSKSSAVVFPIVILCLDFFINKKFEIKFILNKIPFIIIAVSVGMINIKSQAADQFINYSHFFPWFQRIGFAGFALLKYIAFFLFPADLSVIYPYPEIKNSVFIAGYLFLLLLGVVVFFLIRKKKTDWLYLILFIIINLILVLQFLPFGEVLYADRYMYVPVIGFAWITGYLISKIKLPFKIISLILIVLLSISVFIRSSAWNSAVSLYEDIIKKYPKQFIALNSAGVEYMFLNNDAKALEYLNRAVAAAPNNYKGFYNRGLLYLKNNKPELAIKSFNQSLALYNYSKAYVGRAAAYYMLRDIPKAITNANTVLQTDPNNAKARFVLANCYNDLNKLDDALKEYNMCIRINPDDPDFYFKRAIVYGKKQNFNQCLNDLTICIHLNPVYYEAYYWRGVAKLNLKQDPCEDLKVAARNNLEQAVQAFNKYCK